MVYKISKGFRIWAGIFLVLILVGCNAKDKTDDAVKRSEVAASDTGVTALMPYSYYQDDENYKWSAVDTETEEVPVLSDMTRYAVCGDNLYYADGSLWLDSANASGKIVGYSLLEKNFILELSLSDIAEAVCNYAGDFAHLYINAFCADREGNLSFIADMADKNSEINSYLIRYVTGSEKIECVRVDEKIPGCRQKTGYNTINKLISLDDKYYVLMNNEDIYVLNSDGSLSGKLDVENPSQTIDMFVFDSGVWYSGTLVGENSIFRVSPSGESEERKRGFAVSENVMGQADNYLIVKAFVGVKLYNTDTGESTDIFNWTNVGVTDWYVDNAFALSDGSIAVICFDDEKGNVLKFIRKIEKSEDTRKELTIATMGQSNLLDRLVIKFNNSQTEYHALVRYYGSKTEFISNSDAQNKLYLDLVSGKAPDIIDIYRFDVENLVKKGLILDLGSCLDSDSEISRDEYMESILKACTIQNTLIAVPLEFTIESYAVDKKIGMEITDKNGWSFDDLTAYLRKNDGTLFDGYSRFGIMNFMTDSIIERFVDMDERKCDFESDDFTMFMELLKDYPENINDDNFEENMVLDSVLASNFEEFQWTTHNFPDGYIIKGYPTADGEERHIIQTSDAYAVMASSKNKDGAWAFIKFCLKSDIRNGFFSPEKKVLNDMIEYELKNAGKEQEGVNYSSTMKPFVIHYSTQEEIDEILHVMEHVKLSSYSYGEIMQIIYEETESFFAGDRSAQEVEYIIQDRVQLYLDEQD